MTGLKVVMHPRPMRPSRFRSAVVSTSEPGNAEEPPGVGSAGIMGDKLEGPAIEAVYYPFWAGAWKQGMNGDGGQGRCVWG